MIDPEAMRFRRGHTKFTKSGAHDVEVIAIISSRKNDLCSKRL